MITLDTEIELAGARVVVSRRPETSTFDVAFVPEPEDGPGGFTLGFIGQDDDEFLETNLERSITSAIETYRNDGLAI